MKYLKVKINRLYNGIASVRDYIVNDAMKKGMGLELICNNCSKKIDYKDLPKGDRGKEKFKSKFDNKEYNLIDYKWS